MKINVKFYRFIAKFILVITVSVTVLVIAFVAVRVSGRNRLYNTGNSTGPDLSLADIEQEQYENAGANQIDEIDDWQEGDVRYKGVHYRYNSDILTFLFMGIDKNTVVEPVKNGIDGGQADALFLLVLDPSKKEASIIGINRNTMTDVAVYDEDGRYRMDMVAQICLQHGFGDGAASSCERSVDAVSRLFYNLPVNGYCAINMGAVPLINDAVGGVELTALETIPDTWITEGETITLTGEEAYKYVRSRNTDEFASADRRLERQRQYLTAYGAKAMSEMKSDITLPLTIYNTLNKYMVTDISVDEVSYLATQAPDYDFDGSRFYQLEGETVMGSRYEEFYADETALYELILEVFYIEIE